MTKKIPIKIEKILYNGRKIKYLVKFLKSDKLKLMVVTNDLMKKKFPEFLLNFYENRIFNK